MKWLYILIKEFYFSLIVLFSSFKSFFPIFWINPKGKIDTPILLVHGYFNFASVWLYHGRKLSKNGAKFVYTINLGNPTLSIREYAKKVDKKAKEIQKRTGKNDLILIGHSMGGLVISYYAMYFATSNIKKIITLGFPLHGTKLAKLGPGKCAKEMELDSRVLKNLRDKIEKSRIQFYHLGSLRDEFVIPSTSAFSEKRRKRFIRDEGHLGLLYSKKVSSLVWTWIAS